MITALQQIIFVCKETGKITIRCISARDSGYELAVGEKSSNFEDAIIDETGIFLKQEKEPVFIPMSTILEISPISKGNIPEGLSKVIDKLKE